MRAADWGVSFRAVQADDRGLAVVLALGAASAAALVPFVPLLAPFVPGCAFHALTGLPCPACGTTRAVVALAHGDVAGALAWNPLALLALVAAWLAAALAPLWIRPGGALPAFASPLPARARGLVAGLVLLDWGYLVARGV